MAEISLKPSFIPKAKEKEPFWNNFGAYLSIFFVIASVIAYVVFYQLSATQNIKNRELSKKIESAKIDEKNWKEKELIKYKNKIDAFAYLLGQHKKASGIFTFLERTVMPEIVMQNFEANTESNVIIMNGVGKDYYTVAQQILIMKKDPQVSSVRLEDVNLTGEKKVSFKLTATLKPDAYNFPKK